METPAAPPIKRLRTVDNVNECIREFKLLQQYPSMVSPLKGGNMLMKFKSVNGTSQHCQKPPVKSVVLVLNKEGHGLSKLQKSRIKSVCGRDLGEIKLRPMPYNDVSKSLAVSFSTQGAQKKSRTVCQDKIKCLHISSSSLSNRDAVPQRNTDKLSLNENRSQVQITDADRASNLSSSLTTLVTKRLLSETENNQGYVRSNQNCESQIVPKKLNYIKVKPAREVKQIPYSSGSVKKFVRIPLNQKLMLMKRNNGSYSDVYKKQSAKNTRISALEEKCQNTISIGSSPVGTKSVVPLKSMQYKKFAESKFPLVKCEKLSLPVSKLSSTERGIENEKESKAEPLQKNVHKEVPDVSMSTTPSNKKQYITKTNNSNDASTKPLQRDDQNNFHNSDKDIHSIRIGTNTCTNGTRESQINSVGNCNGTDNNTRNCSTTKINEREVQNSAVSNCIQSVENRLHNENDRTNSECITNLLNWSILQEAVNSVPNKELRAKALQALAACGTGSERQVPKPLPSDLRTVQDSTVQTEVFGLIDKDNFVLVREDVPDIQRIKQVERASLPLPTTDINMTTQCNLLVNEQFFPTTVPLQINNLDELFTSVIADNENAFKINDILNNSNQTQTSTQICNKVYKQLRKDFDTYKQFDGFGWLSIHRAVISNRLQDVDRHIMILEACKESIDILTQDGMTSLELAINFDVCPQIVSTLLQAGAQPALIKPVHDSALILASKLSSTMLSELVKYTSTNEPLKRRGQLDQLDSTGFAALHYCAQKGNKEGVNALLRAGATANLRDGRSGRTALFHAVENEYFDVVQELYNYGAAIDIPNFAGQTILSLTDVLKNSPFKSSLNRIMK